ncbi:MAG TPA: HipA family kinase [Bryobacteraceae bacterium]|nr:HipA family kinase [Bryobacteraceae bacterium]
MPIRATRFIRKMRGGAQAHLLQADDGNFYVVKFTNNPQHRRILINEWTASVFLNYLQIPAPATAIVEITTEFLAENPEVHIQLGMRRIDVEPGWHFGSRHPGDPLRTAVYDFLPDALLDKVANTRDFLGVFAVDKWMGNADARQCIFFRARLRNPLSPVGERPGFVAQMVDHGYLFDGPHWTFMDSPLQGFYFRPVVYSQVRSLTDFEPWLERIVNFPEKVIDDAYKQIPLAWIDGDSEALEALLEKLLQRRRRVPELIAAARGVRSNPFPEWK